VGIVLKALISKVYIYINLVIALSSVIVLVKGILNISMVGFAV